MSPKKGSLAAQRILVVDDEADVDYSFQRVLAEEPVEVLGEGTQQIKEREFRFSIAGCQDRGGKRN